MKEVVKMFDVQGIREVDLGFSGGGKMGMYLMSYLLYILFGILVKLNFL